MLAFPVFGEKIIELFMHALDVAAIDGYPQQGGTYALGRGSNIMQGISIFSVELIFDQDLAFTDDVDAVDILEDAFQNLLFQYIVPAWIEAFLMERGVFPFLRNPGFPLL